MPHGSEAASRSSETGPRRSRFSPLEYRDPAPAPWLIHALGTLNRLAILPWLLKLRRFDLPAADRARLAAAVNPGTVAFLGPNHPEFLTDWMVDKELSRRLSPLMAHWASYEIVNASPLARSFWLANNLIANVPAGGGKAYSVAWALRGHGVLLHPEGTATWQAGRVAPLLPGIVDMARDAAARLRSARDGRPVWLVPVVWRMVFLGDARRGLARDLGVIERGVGLASGRRLPVPERFATLMRRLLALQCERLGLGVPAPGPDVDYFAAQASAMAALARDLATRYGTGDPDLTRTQFQLRKAMRERAATDPEGVRRDRARLAELQRLASLDPALYDRPELEQERIAEVLKRTRSSLLTRGLAHSLHNMFPIAAGPRVVHVRAAEPIPVAAPSVTTASEDEARLGLLAELRSRLQATLDRLAAELEPDVAGHRLSNPLHRG